jgi:hypothetical protein
MFPNFRWFVLTAQPSRALDINPLVSWHQGMYHLRQSHSPTLFSTFLRGEDSFEIVVTVPAGEDTQEAQQLP